MCKETRNHPLVTLSRNFDYSPEKVLENIDKYPRDVTLVTKERLELKVHKVVLARYKFWYQLFQSMVGANGVCPAEPLIVELPDYDYKSVRLVVSGYYCDRVPVSQKQNEQFTQLVRAFNQDLGICNQCRVCKNKVSDHLILEHMKNHIKYCADNDKKSHSSNLGSELRCSFKQDSNCSISYLHNHQTVDQTINQHYRHHFREELAYIKQNFSTKIPNELSLFEFADIHDNDNGSKKDNESDNNGSSGNNSDTEENDKDLPVYYPTTDRIEDIEDDYSGGMSSPSSSDEESNDGRRYPVMEGRDPMMEARMSRCGSTDSPEEGIFTCRECGQKFKREAGFKKHIVTKHVSKKLEEYIIKYYGPVNKKSIVCKMPGKCKGKSFQKMWQFSLHMGTAHNILATFLTDCRHGESIQDWDSSGNLAASRRKSEMSEASPSTLSKYRGGRSSGPSEEVKEKFENVATKSATDLETIEISDDDESYNDANHTDDIELERDEKVIVNDGDSESDKSTLLPEQPDQMDFN